MKGQTTSLLCGMTAAAAAAVPSTRAAAQVIAPVMECAALADLATDVFVVETAEIVPAGPAPNPSGEPLPEHCLVQGTLDPRTGQGGRSFGIGFDLRMPTAWSGRLAFQGGGGLDGMLVGRAPDRIVATGEAFPGVSRPLCPYPLVARYEGGNPADAGSFACRE